MSFLPSAVHLIFFYLNFNTLKLVVMHTLLLFAVANKLLKCILGISSSTCVITAALKTSWSFTVYNSFISANFMHCVLICIINQICYKLTTYQALRCHWTKYSSRAFHSLPAIQEISTQSIHNTNQICNWSV